MTVEEAVEHAKARGYEPVALCAYKISDDTIVIIDLGASERSKEAFYKCVVVDGWKDLLQ